MSPHPNGFAEKCMPFPIGFGETYIPHTNPLFPGSKLWMVLKYNTGIYTTCGQ